jgi:uncharacterized RDD family membrane protein YckC
MKYIISGDDGKEYGPIDQETLRKWVESGRVLPTTLVRNQMMKKWSRAADLDFLKTALETQTQRVEEDKSAFEHGLDFIKSIFKKKTVVKNINTTFKYEYIHNPAPVYLRIGAATFDWLLLSCFACLLFLVFSIAIKTDIDVNFAFTASLIVFFGGTLLYYSLALGIYAQTFGMWFWGIMIVSSDIGEVFLGRAYFYTINMLVFGLLSPIIVYLNPEKRSLHEYISGTRIIRIAARPKA